MDENTVNQISIKEEITLCLAIVDKFVDALSDCKEDYDTLMSLKDIDGDSPEWKEAFQANLQRTEDVEVSLHIVTERISKLKTQLLPKESLENKEESLEEKEDYLDYDEESFKKLSQKEREAVLEKMYTLLDKYDDPDEDE